MARPDVPLHPPPPSSGGSLGIAAAAAVSNPVRAGPSTAPGTARLAVVALRMRLPMPRQARLGCVFQLVVSVGYSLEREGGARPYLFASSGQALLKKKLTPGSVHPAAIFKPSPIGELVRDFLPSNLGETCAQIIGFCTTFFCHYCMF